MKVKILNTRKKPERTLGERVALPMFEMVSCPTVRIADIRRRRFNVIDRAQQAAREEIAAQEDKAVFAALEAAVEPVTQNEIIRSGLLMITWGADIIVSRGRLDFDDEEA